VDVIVGGAVGGLGVLLLGAGIFALVRRLRAMESVARQLANKQRVFVGGSAAGGLELGAMRTLAAGGTVDNPLAGGKTSAISTGVAPRSEHARSAARSSGSGSVLRVSRLWGGGGGRLTRAVGEVVVVADEKAAV
jgi:hypothetical protein